MKRVIIAAALVFTTALITLYTRPIRLQHTVSPVKVSVFNYQKELASAD